MAWHRSDWAWWRLDGWELGRPKRKEGKWGDTIETNWSRDGLRRQENDRNVNSFWGTASVASDMGWL